MTRWMHRARTAAVLVSLAAAAALSAAPRSGAPVPGPHEASGPAAQAPDDQRPVFRGGTNAVVVDVYPQRDGRIVENLVPEDFEVFEDGVRQTIQSVELVRVDPVLSDSLRRDPNNQIEMAAAVANPRNRVFVVFLDTLHVTLTGSNVIRRPLLDALNRIMAEDDLVGVMTENHHPAQLAFGRRLLVLEEQLSRYWTWGQRGRIGASAGDFALDPSDPVEDVLSACFSKRLVPGTGAVDWTARDGGREDRLDRLLILRRRADRVMTSLEALVAHLGSVREARTAAILVTDGWRLLLPNPALANEAGQIVPGPAGITGGPGGQLSGRRQMGAGTVDRAGCNGELLRLAATDFDQRLRELVRQAGRANVAFYPITPSGLEVWESLSGGTFDPAADARAAAERTQGLQLLADGTGGIAVVRTNDLDAGMRRIVADVSTYYLISYTSTNAAVDDRFREIDVRVRVPGVDVRARQGYVASRRVDPTRPSGVNAGVSAAIMDARAALDRLRPDADLHLAGRYRGGAVQVVVEIGSRELSGGRWNDGADATLAVTDRQGQVIGRADGRIEAGTRSTRLTVAIDEDAGPVTAAATVRAGRERLSDEIALDPPGASVGLLAEPTLFRATPSPRSPLWPAAAPAFLRTERLHVEWPVTGPASTPVARLLDARGEALDVPVAVAEADGAIGRAMSADLVLAPLAEGDYLIEIAVEGGGRTERRLVAFRVTR